MAELDSVIKSLDSVESNLQNVQKEFAEGKTSQKALSDEIKKLGEEQAKLATTLAETTQKLDLAEQSESKGLDAVKSVGQLAAEHDSVKSYKAGVICFSVNKAVASSGLSNSSTRTTYLPAYQAGMVTMPDSPLEIEQLFPHIPVSVDTIEYLKEGAVTDGSKIVAEGAAFGETTITKPSIATANVVNIGAFATLTHQLITNESAFAAYINTKMQYKMKLAIESQLINGIGGSTQLSGLLNTGNYTDKTADVIAALPKTGATMFDFALLLKTEFEKQYITPECLILNPNDWVQLAMLKDTKGNYILGGPQALASHSLWGVPVMETQVIPSGKFILGNFNLGATIYDREALDFRISDQDGDNFKSMLYTLRVNRRMGFAVENPKAIFAGAWSLTAPSND